jgi:hypothetical protein
VIEEPDPDDADEAELIQLAVRRRPEQTAERDSHAQGL